MLTEVVFQASHQATGNVGADEADAVIASGKKRVSKPFIPAPNSAIAPSSSGGMSGNPSMKRRLRSPLLMPLLCPGESSRAALIPSKFMPSPDVASPPPESRRRGAIGAVPPPTAAARETMMASRRSADALILILLSMQPRFSTLVNATYVDLRRNTRIPRRSDVEELSSRRA